MKKLLGILAALWLAGCSYTPTTPTTFEYACAAVEELTDNNCDSLDAPVVVESYILEDLRRLTGWKTLYGMYYGGIHIFIHPEAPDKPKTIVHETVHYILRHPSTKIYKDRCQGEYYARLIANNYNNEPYDDGWRKDYRCEKPVGLMQPILR